LQYVAPKSGKFKNLVGMLWKMEHDMKNQRAPEGYETTKIRFYCLSTRFCCRYIWNLRASFWLQNQSTASRALPS
jgi:hypothetical protein